MIFTATVSLRSPATAQAVSPRILSSTLPSSSKRPIVVASPQSGEAPTCPRILVPCPDVAISTHISEGGRPFPSHCARASRLPATSSLSSRCTTTPIPSSSARIAPSSWWVQARPLHPLLPEVCLCRIGAEFVIDAPTCPMSNRQSTANRPPYAFQVFMSITRSSGRGTCTCVLPHLVGHEFAISDCSSSVPCRWQGQRRSGPSRHGRQADPLDAQVLALSANLGFSDSSAVLRRAPWRWRAAAIT